MSGIACDQIRTAALDPGTRPGDWTRRPEAAAHIRQCTACQDWLDAFAAGVQAWVSEPADAFAAGVIARTAGVETVLRDLPMLADMDPGPGFAERVLAATSRKPAPQGWRPRVSGAWWALVRRPRFAWEAAYLATVCWVLVFGNPVGAIEWSATNIGAVARERLGPPVKELRADLETWRGRLAAEPARKQGAAAGQQGEDTVPLVVRAWQTAAEWLQHASASFIDAIARTWGSVAAWIGGLVDQAAPPPAEPPADPARSPQ
jgi:hypothetical protein